MTDLFNSMLAVSDVLGEDNDCAVTAVAIACGVSYGRAYHQLASLGRPFGQPTYNGQIFNAIKFFDKTVVDVRHRFSARTARTLSRELVPDKRTYLIRTHDHVYTAHNGVIHDTDTYDLKRIIDIWQVVPATPERTHYFKRGSNDTT